MVHPFELLHKNQNMSPKKFQNILSSVLESFPDSPANIRLGCYYEIFLKKCQLIALIYCTIHCLFFIQGKGQYSICGKQINNVL
jgi:hypothetical protein